MLARSRYRVRCVQGASLFCDIPIDHLFDLQDMSLGYRDQWGIAATHRNAAHAASQKQMYQDIATAHKRAFAPHNLDAAAMSFKWREIMPPEVENGTLEHLA